MAKYTPNVTVSNTIAGLLGISNPPKPVAGVRLDDLVPDPGRPSTLAATIWDDGEASVAIGDNTIVLSAESVVELVEMLTAVS